MKKYLKPLIVVTLFAMTMAVLESAIVVYLRALYYPGEFTVAMRLIDPHILLIEIAREAATVIMLLTIGWLAGSNFRERLAYFLFSFAVWDIFYYVWLKVFINWPATIFDWDILFLIPFTWLAPVIAPVICSVTMILLTAALLNRSKESISRLSWTMLIIGSALILYTFMEDYGRIIFSNGFYRDYASIMENKDFISIAVNYLPVNFGWPIFFAGELLLLTGVATVFKPGAFYFGDMKTKLTS